MTGSEYLKRQGGHLMNRVFSTKGAYFLKKKCPQRLFIGIADEISCSFEF